MNLADELEDINNAPTQIIHVWPDGTWCYPSELVNYNYMSDDYTYEQLPDDWDWERIDAWVAKSVATYHK
jgi:hypothetical protein